MKPRVVIRRISDGQFRRGSYGWTDNLQLARVFRSEGVAAGSRTYGKEGTEEYVPVKLVPIAQANQG